MTLKQSLIFKQHIYWFVSNSDTVSMSLSPLPLKPNNTMESRERVGANFERYAIPCAGSRAGIIPSVLVNSLNPTIAS